MLWTCYCLHVRDKINRLIIEWTPWIAYYGIKEFNYVFQTVYYASYITLVIKRVT